MGQPERVDVGGRERLLVVRVPGEAQQPPELLGDVEGYAGPLGDLEPGERRPFAEQVGLDVLEGAGEVLVLAQSDPSRDLATSSIASMNFGISALSS